MLLTYALDGDAYGEPGRLDDEVVIDEPVPLRFARAQLLG